MQERHTNRELYFREQGYTTVNHVIPYLESVKPVSSESRILEIGCGEGGNLVPFLDIGCETVGIDMDLEKMENARKFLSDHPSSARLKLINGDIYEMNPDSIGAFDFVLLRDVIEHIRDQKRFMGFVKKFLVDDGVIFFGFPPWCMPFGGHQQGCRSRLLSNFPFLHLLPPGLYTRVLRLFNESPGTINGLMKVRETRISIRRFQKILRHHDYRILKQTYFLINPNYEIKFKLRQRVVWKVFQIPGVCDFYTTAFYCVAGRNCD